MQADYDFRSCRTCGLLFAGGLPSDEKLHRVHHAAVLQGVKAQVGGVPAELRSNVCPVQVPHLTLMQRYCRAYPSQCPWSGSDDPAAGCSAGTDWWWSLMTLETRTKRFVLSCCWSLLLWNLLQCHRYKYRLESPEPYIPESAACAVLDPGCSLMQRPNYRAGG